MPVGLNVLETRSIVLPSGLSEVSARRTRQANLRSTGYVQMKHIFFFKIIISMIDIASSILSIAPRVVLQEERRLSGPAVSETAKFLLLMTSLRSLEWVRCYLTDVEAAF